MNASNYDVVIVGAGAAGLTAAIGLARAGFSVAAIEAAPFPGAENWSGCVYFCENLAHSAILGPEGVEALAWERRLVERGFFASDGYGLLGMKYRDPQAFRHCYTVLRPIYDHHLAHVAERFGVAILNSTTVESLIRESGRVIGVCTNRGSLYANLVFLAEGDASHLVTREGYERYTDRRAAPRFLHGIKQVINLPPGAIEERFRVRPEEGVAYEILLRNGTLAGRTVPLNMGGFIYSNRQSLSVGLVLPADNLSQHFGGDPNLLIEWFENLPALQPWLRGGERGVFGAKIIRGGGAKDIPNLIDEGLAIGGAASAIGVDFPYPNFTGPATAMGLLVTQAACRIRDEGGDFSRENLRRHYLEPLQQTHYWDDVEFLRRWPGYVKRTQAFFDRNLDLALGTAYVWTRPNRWFLTKWVNWIRLLLQVSGPSQWREMRTDFRHFIRALRLKEVISRPTLGRLFLDGTINALRDLAGSPRANLPAAGSMNIVYTVADEAEPTSLPPRSWRRWFQRVAPVLASGARRVYMNNKEPLATKLPETSHLLMRQLNLLDLISFVFFAFAAAFTGGMMLTWQRLVRAIRGQQMARRPKGVYPLYSSSARRICDLTSSSGVAEKEWDARLARLAYHSVKSSHIHVLWPKSLQNKNKIVTDGLWHVCPARVYEARVTGRDQVQVVINFENCIKCETCWRTGDLADWGRDGKHRFVYPVASPVVSRLLSAVHTAGLSRTPPRLINHWEPLSRDAAGRMQSAALPVLGEHENTDLHELYALLSNLEGKLEAFDKSLAQEPRTVDRARSESLETLARYTQQLALRVVEILRGSTWADSPNSGIVLLHRRLLDLATSMLAKAEDRTRRTWDQRLAWAAADGRQMHYHHVVGLRHLLKPLSRDGDAALAEPDVLGAWVRAESNDASVAEKVGQWRRHLDSAFPTGSWREIEDHPLLSGAQDSLLRELLAQVPQVDNADLGNTLHPPIRKALLAELGRRDPSLAYSVASHLWARDLTTFFAVTPSNAIEPWATGKEWACFAPFASPKNSTQTPTALFIPARRATRLLILAGDYLSALPANAPGLRIEALPTLGLRGAGLTEVRLEDVDVASFGVKVDSDAVMRMWQVLSSADLVSIASGMTDELGRRSIAHATSRVQFPGLFHDEEAHDAVGKFGAVKKMVAQLGARRYVLETLDHTLSPTDFSAEACQRACLVKALAAELLGTAPGSASYNAGQIFGGTGYSEDDILSKFYRDASAWRFLGASNPDVYRTHGERLLRNWHPDGRRLSTVPNEAQLLEQVAQRKALQAELDEVRVFRSRLRTLINEWYQQEGEPGTPSANGVTANTRINVEAAEFLARQDAQLMASKALLLRTHARWERNLDAELETVLMRVWLEDASVSLEELEAMIRRTREASAGPQSRPLIEPTAPAISTTYEAYLATDRGYASGDFLSAPLDVRQSHFVPEMVQADPVLAQRDREIADLMKGQFGGLRQGMSYERYIEGRHRPDAEDVDFCRKHGFFRMPIPKELGGEGRQEVDYYLLITNAQRRADVGISLCIQVNTSIGTTPILLARDKDLPKALEQLQSFVADAAIQKEIATRLDRFAALLPLASPRRVEQLFTDLDHRLEENVLSRTALRSLAPQVADSWMQVRKSFQEANRIELINFTREAVGEWKRFCRRTQEMHEELGRRLEACSQALRWIASGQISGFALTEPSAGSDTARLATRAKRRSALVEQEPNGTLRFFPVGQRKMPCYLLDAEKLEFRADGVFYRWSETAEASRICFDEYDYETDDPRKMRYYRHGGEKIHFTDIGQLRQRDGKLWYDYWELSGAKMWITNGRLAGLFCLYAKTEEGVTGFIVDRHAEGLVVGKDEAKLGQWGSPTNELSLQVVRVPLENVLGIEGRGQVNALESLNVGRAGLAISGMAQMSGIIEKSAEFARASHGGIPDWVEWRLARMEEDRFTAEAIAYEVVGRFEHPKTKSVRMESAIAKMLVSEILHRVIETAEEIYGLDGQTRHHLIEKRKRDARVYPIYEGTNEIQRFFILKDLVAEVAPRWQRGAQPTLPDYMSREVLEIEALKSDLRHRIFNAVDVFGQQLWQNPNLQASCFLLAESAAWLFAAGCTLCRRAWLEQRDAIDEDGEPLPELEIGRRATARCVSEIRARLRRFEEELSHLRRGFYGPEIRAASLLFERTEQAPSVQKSKSSITRPLSILVVVEPSPSVPRPQLSDGRLQEPYLTLDAADQSAIQTALELRDRATAPVSIEVAAVGPRGYARVLREVLYLGVDRVRLIVSESDTIAPQCAAQALAAVLANRPPFDVILGGSAEADCQEGLLARLTAEAVGVAFAGKAAALGVRQTDSSSELTLFDSAGRPLQTRSLQAAIAIEGGVSLRAFTTEGFLNNVARVVELERWPKKVPVQSLLFREMTIAELASKSELTSAILRPQEAATQARRLLGLEARRPRALAPFEGTIDDVASPTLSQAGVVAILAVNGEGRLHQTGLNVIRAAALVSTHERCGLALVALVPLSEAAQRLGLRQIAEVAAADAVLVPTSSVDSSEEIKSQVVRDCLTSLSWNPKVVVGESWTEDAFSFLSQRQSQTGIAILRVRGIAIEEDRLIAQTSRLHNKLRAEQPIVSEPGAVYWIHLAPDAEVGPVRSRLPASAVRVQRWVPRLGRQIPGEGLHRVVADLKEEIGLVRLSDADFIIDVGAGVGNRDGYEALVEPLEKCLRELGVRNVLVGGSRKATEELHLLPPDRQIGQSGVSVNPQVLLALGISGAPQHLNYIATRASILAFNRDPEAPIMTLNQRTSRPKVIPVVGDLFETIPAFISALREESPVSRDPSDMPQSVFV
jgi:electron transfer flavoprotein-quinone oxidoreductase